MPTLFSLLVLFRSLEMQARADNFLFQPINQLTKHNTNVSRPTYPSRVCLWVKRSLYWNSTRPNHKSGSLLKVDEAQSQVEWEPERESSNWSLCTCTLSKRKLKFTIYKFTKRINKKNKKKYKTSLHDTLTKVRIVCFFMGD